MFSIAATMPALSTRHRYQRFAARRFSGNTGVLPVASAATGWKPVGQDRQGCLSSTPRGTRTLRVRQTALHPSATLIKFQTAEHVLHVLSRSRKIDVLAEDLRRNRRRIVPPGPTLRATRAGVVLRQCEGNGIDLIFPMLERARQIPRARLQIHLWIEKLFYAKIFDLGFLRPLDRGSLRHLH